MMYIYDGNAINCIIYAVISLVIVIAVVKGEIK